MYIIEKKYMLLDLRRRYNRSRKKKDYLTNPVAYRYFTQVNTVKCRNMIYKVTNVDKELKYTICLY